MILIFFGICILADNKELFVMDRMAFLPRKIFVLSALTIAALGMGCSLAETGILSEIPADTKVESCSYQIVNTYPHDENAFTQGLVYYDGYLYEGTGLRSRSSLRRVDLETGKVVQKIDLENKYFGEGITLFEDRLIQLTWVSQIGFVYDRESFEKLQEFTYPTEGWGLTHDGQNLIMSDGSDRLFFLDPETFEEVKQISVSERNEPVEMLNELEYIKGEIYANVWMSERIVRIDPTTGQVLGWIDLSGLRNPALAGNRDAVLNGIAYDSKKDRLFVTGKLWPNLFEIEIVCN